LPHTLQHLPNIALPIPREEGGKTPNDQFNAFARVAHLPEDFPQFCWQPYERRENIVGGKAARGYV
jgi:hypothetical protein